MRDNLIIDMKASEFLQTGHMTKGSSFPIKQNALIWVAEFRLPLFLKQGCQYLTFVYRRNGYILTILHNIKAAFRLYFEQAALFIYLIS